MVDNFYGESGFQIVKNAPFLYRCDRTFTPEVDSCLQTQIEEFEEEQPTPGKITWSGVFTRHGS